MATVTGDELKAAGGRFSNPKPTEAYRWRCDMIEQPALRVADMAKLARAYLAERTWQPIATAPKTPDDLTTTVCILVAVPNRLHTPDGENGPAFDLYVAYWEPRPPYQCWCVGDPEVQANRVTPTHWVSLPEPPTIGIEPKE